MAGPSAGAVLLVRRARRWPRTLPPALALAWRSDSIAMRSPGVEGGVRGTERPGRREKREKKEKKKKQGSRV